MRVPYHPAGAISKEASNRGIARGARSPVTIRGVACRTLPRRRDPGYGEAPGLLASVSMTFCNLALREKGKARHLNRKLT